MTTGERIRMAREARGLTQSKLGERCGIAEPTIRKYEHDWLHPKIETLEKIAEALQMDVKALREDSQTAKADAGKPRPTLVPVKADITTRKTGARWSPSATGTHYTGTCWRTWRIPTG